MNQFERHAKIRAILAEKRFIDAHEIEGLLGISKAAVRRDLLWPLSTKTWCSEFMAGCARRLSDNNSQVVDSIRAMMKVAQRVIVAAGHTKFGRTAMIHVADLSEIHQIIADRDLRQEYLCMLHEKQFNACWLSSRPVDRRIEPVTADAAFGA